MGRAVHAFQSIRFRLSFAVAVTVFAVGSLFVGGIYAWQVNRLEEPTLAPRPVVLRDLSTGREFETSFSVLSSADIGQAVAEQIEINAYQRALLELRRSAFVGLVALFVTSFGAGWLISGWVLRPIERMNRVAREITATDLSRRISLQGPTDELKGLADTFDLMLDRLQVSFDGQQRFVQEASHELRNPLASARTNLELVLDEEDPEQLRHAVAVAHRATDRMSVLVEDLLQRARSDLGPADRSVVMLAPLLHDVAEEFQAAAEDRSITLEVAIPDVATGVCVDGDESALMRAVSNLVVNAVRLGPESSTVTLALSVSTRHSSDPEVEIHVIDEGPGVAEEDRDAIFLRFWRGDDVGQGSGLGLSIVREVAERHGGSAFVRSAGPGSCFVLCLPARAGVGDTGTRSADCVGDDASCEAGASPELVVPADRPETTAAIVSRRLEG